MEHKTIIKAIVDCLLMIGAGVVFTCIVIALIGWLLT